MFAVLSWWHTGASNKLGLCVMVCFLEASLESRDRYFDKVVIFQCFGIFLWFGEENELLEAEKRRNKMAAHAYNWISLCVLQ